MLDEKSDVMWRPFPDLPTMKGSSVSTLNWSMKTVTGVSGIPVVTRNTCMESYYRDETCANCHTHVNGLWYEKHVLKEKPDDPSFKTIMQEPTTVDRCPECTRSDAISRDHKITDDRINAAIATSRPGAPPLMPPKGAVDVVRRGSPRRKGVKRVFDTGGERDGDGDDGGGAVVNTSTMDEPKLRWNRLTMSLELAPT